MLFTIDVLIVPQASHPIRAYFWHSCETMLGSSGSGGPAGSGTGRSAFGKGSRQVDVGNSRGASQLVVASSGVAQPARQELVEEILQLGRMLEHTRNPFRVEEKKARGSAVLGTQGGRVEKGAGGGIGQLGAGKRRGARCDEWWCCSARSAGVGG